MASTLALPLRRLLTTSSTSTSFSAKIPTATEPSGEGVLNLLAESVGVGGGVCVPRHVQIVPFGGDANNETFDFMVYGWSKTAGTVIYIPQLLIDCSVTLGNIDAAAAEASQFMADTITVNDGPSDGPGRSVISPEDDLPGSVLLHTRGCQYLEFVFDLTGTADRANVWWRAVDD
jgi:hypothetical protein